MNTDDVIKMAREAGLPMQYRFVGGATHWDFDGPLEKFAALVAATEREACIKLLEDFSQTQMVPVVDTWRMGLVAGANAIRQRGRNEQR